MKKQTMINILLIGMSILAIMYLWLTLTAIQEIVNQKAEIEYLNDEITMKNIEIDSLKETIYRQKYNF